MKNTILMLAIIATFILTWMFISTIGYLLSQDVTFREVATHGGTLMTMLIFGWIPAVITGSDLNERLDD
jgi:hypothetical protein